MYQLKRVKKLVPVDEFWQEIARGYKKCTVIGHWTKKISTSL
jgi:hypothetical protein